MGGRQVGAVPGTLAFHASNKWCLPACISVSRHHATSKATEQARLGHWSGEGQHVKRICVATNGAHGNYVVTTTPGAQSTRQCGDLLESPNALSTKKHHSIIFQVGRCCTNEDDGTSDDECDNHVNAVFERVQMIAMVLVILETALTQTIVLLLRAVVVLVLAALVMLTMVMLCFAIS